MTAPFSCTSSETTLWLLKKALNLVSLNVLLQACSSVDYWQPPNQSFSGGHWPGIDVCWGLYRDCKSQRNTVSHALFLQED